MEGFHAVVVAKEVFVKPFQHLFFVRLGLELGGLKTD